MAAPAPATPPVQIPTAGKCSFCTKEIRVGSVNKCSACKIAIYCDKACQKKDWNKDCHVRICPLLQEKDVVKRNESLVKFALDLMDNFVMQNRTHIRAMVTPVKSQLLKGKPEGSVGVLIFDFTFKIEGLSFFVRNYDDWAWTSLIRTSQLALSVTGEAVKAHELDPNSKEYLLGSQWENPNLTVVMNEESTIKEVPPLPRGNPVYALWTTEHPDNIPFIISATLITPEKKDVFELKRKHRRSIIEAVAVTATAPAATASAHPKP